MHRGFDIVYELRIAPLSKALKRRQPNRFFTAEHSPYQRFSRFRISIVRQRLDRGQIRARV
jgi:hypothetical protein